VDGDSYRIGNGLASTNLMKFFQIAIYKDFCGILLFCSCGRVSDSDSNPLADRFSYYGNTPTKQYPIPKKKKTVVGLRTFLN
jgi:hypothetical protein